MLKIGRRPYTSCPYRWSLSTSGISTGEGDCSEEQCLDLNGDFLLDFKACDSKGGKLVWANECEGNIESDPSPCMICETILNNNLPWTPPEVNYTESGATIVWGTGWTGILGWSSLFYDRTFACEWSDRKFGTITTSDPDSVAFPPPDMGGGYGGRKYWVESSPGVFTCDLLLYATFRSASRRIDIHAAIPDWDDPDVLAGSRQLFLATGYIGDPASCETPETFAVDSSATLNTTAFDFSGEVVVTYSGEGGSTGPDKNDRIRSKWHLEYDIEAQLWTLRSFNRIDYPIYTLSDSDPCTGYTKTLLLADKGDAADGCGVAPSEVTITRVCPPDRVGKSALLEDRKPNGATGKTKRQCGCDCQDEVDDRRHTCATKCTSTEDEGCGNINPAPDDITCRYPEAINCCENTAGKDVPCAYTVEFECDIFFDIEDVRHKIAAKQVVMRRECYFENGCEFVAAGPESSTGGSPVMDTDGFPGAQPVCSSCADLCLTGCTWDAWTVAACPPPAGGCDCGLALCYDTTPLTANVGTIAGLTQTTIQLDAALPYDVLPRCRTYVSFIGTIENRDVFGLNYSMFADLQLSERCLSLSLQYFDNSVSSTTFEYATYTATVPEPIVCPDSIIFTKTSGGSVFPNTVEITNP